MHANKAKIVIGKQLNQQVDAQNGLQTMELTGNHAVYSRPVKRTLRDFDEFDEKMCELDEKIWALRRGVDDLKAEKERLEHEQRRQMQWIDAMTRLSRYGMLVLGHGDLDEFTEQYNQLNDLYQFRFALSDVEYCKHLDLDVYEEGLGDPNETSREIKWQASSRVYALNEHVKINGVETNHLKARMHMYFETSEDEYEESDDGTAYRFLLHPECVLIKKKSIPTLRGSGALPRLDEELVTVECEMVDEYDLQFHPIPGVSRSDCEEE